MTGTPNILSLAALDAALDVFADIDSRALNDKAGKLSDLFLELVRQAPELATLKLESPQNSTDRAAQLAYSHPRAWSLSRALLAEGVMVDYREPDLLRFGFSPLNVSFEEVWRSVEILRRIVNEKVYEKEMYQHRTKVT